MSKIKKSELLAIVREQGRAITTLLQRVTELERNSVASKSELKTLDQSVFEGLDEKWRFAAVDEDSRAFFYDCEPAVNVDEWYEGDSQLMNIVGTGYDATDWQNSLIERKAELTGRDLVRAMLSKNGDKCVMCRVTDNANIPVKDWLLVVVEMSNIGYHDYIIPINNQGEPLTAKDVGL